VQGCATARPEQAYFAVFQGVGVFFVDLRTWFRYILPTWMRLAQIGVTFLIVETYTDD
jgi:hypothetical protein